MANMRMGMAPMNGIGDPEKRKQRLERRETRQKLKVQEANARMAARASEKRRKNANVPKECTKDGGCDAYDSSKNAEPQPTLLKDTKLVKGVKKAAKAIGEVFERKAPRLRKATPGARRRYAKRVHEYNESLRKRENRQNQRENRQNQRESSRTARQETRMENKDKRIMARGERKVARIEKKIERVNTRAKRQSERKAQRVERRASGGGIMSIFKKKKGPKKIKGTF